METTKNSGRTGNNGSERNFVKESLKGKHRFPVRKG